MTIDPRVMLLLACAVLSGCNFGSLFGPDEADEDLAAGIQSYEDGNYRDAARLIQDSLDAGLRSTSEKVKAHKYLAFIHCNAGRGGPCREEFRKALELDSSFQLDESEIGNPNWGPVFRSVKIRK